jgi:hypothetical protein
MAPAALLIWIGHKKARPRVFGGPGAIRVLMSVYSIERRATKLFLFTMRSRYNRGTATNWHVIPSDGGPCRNRTGTPEGERF